jgi:anti-sigma B factor antagonist
VVDYQLFAMDGPLRTGALHPLFDLRQRRDADGTERVTLTGELDLSATAGLKARLGEVQRAQHRLRLDLSELDFIDCSGIRAILEAMADARREGCAVEVDRAVSPMVGRIVSLGAIAAELWPGETAAQAGTSTAA